MNRFKNQQYSSKTNTDTNCNVQNASLTVTDRRSSTMDHVIHQANYTSNRQARNTNMNRYENEYESNCALVLTPLPLNPKSAIFIPPSNVNLNSAIDSEIAPCVEDNSAFRELSNDVSNNESAKDLAPTLGGVMERRHSYQCDEAFDSKDCVASGVSGNVGTDGDLNEASDLSQNQSKCGYFFIIGEVEIQLIYKN